MTPFPKKPAAIPTLTAARLVAGVAVLGFGFSGVAHAAGTQAGTKIENTATASFTPPSGGSSVEVQSNKVEILVDEIIDVNVDWQDPADVVVNSPSTNRPLKFRVTNTGNGPEKFSLVADTAITGDQFDPTNPVIYLDSNNNGGYDEGIDALYTGNEPVIPADGAITVFVLSSIPAGRQDGDKGHLKLTATAMTGSGTPGTSFAGKGHGGGDAIIGISTGTSNDRGTYVVSNAMVTLTKSASVADPWGGQSRVPGSVITYTLLASINGSGTVSGLRLNDPIPAGVVYVPGSMTLAGTALTDAADADAGQFNGTAISVSIGNATAPSTQTVTFKVKIAE